MKQKETNLEEYKNGLSPIQEQIAALLASGKTISDTAIKAKVSRSTIYRLLENSVFMAYYNLLCKEQKINIENNLFALQEKAFEAIKNMLESKNEAIKLKSSIWIIEKTQGIKIGNTNPIHALHDKSYIYCGDGFSEFSNVKFEQLKKEYGFE